MGKEEIESFLSWLAADQGVKLPPYLPALLRDAPLAKRCRPAEHPGITGAQVRRNDDDLYPCRGGVEQGQSDQPVGSVGVIECMFVGKPAFASMIRLGGQNRSIFEPIVKMATSD